MNTPGVVWRGMCIDFSVACSASDSKHAKSLWGLSNCRCATTLRKCFASLNNKIVRLYEIHFRGMPTSRVINF